MSEASRNESPVCVSVFSNQDEIEETNLNKRQNQLTAGLNEEQMNLDDLFRISEDLKKNMANVFNFLKDKQSYKEIEKNSVDTKDFIREKIIYSNLNKKFKSKINSNSAKYAAMCGMFTKKIKEIEKVKQTLRNEKTNEIIPNWKDIYDTFRSTVKNQMHNNISSSLSKHCSNKLLLNLPITSIPQSCDKILCYEDECNDNLERISSNFETCSGDSVHSLILSHLGNINDNIKGIENILQQNKTVEPKLKNSKKTAAIELKDNFFQDLNKIVNEDKKELAFDLCFLSFDLLIMAKYILDLSQINQNTIMKPQLSTKLNTSYQEYTTVSKENQTGICFSFEPILNEQPVDSFNKNVISLRINKLLDKTLKKTNENSKEICKKCKAFYVSNSQKTNQNQWKCWICTNINQIKFTNNCLEMDMEYIKNVNDQHNRVINTNNNNECKIIVFCIDVSGSMSGNRLEIVKKASINTIKLLKEKKPEYKVALVTFESRSMYYGHGDINENIFDSSNINSRNQDIFKSMCSNLLPIKSSYDYLERKINSLNGSGGTRICSALIQSVHLASTIPNSQVILCTDGCAEDKSEHTYALITDFCNKNGFVKINIISFDENDIDLNTLGKLAYNTGGKTSKTSDAIDFDTFFSKTVENAFKAIQGSVNIKILSDSQMISLEQKGFKLELKNIDINTEEILVELIPNKIQNLSAQMQNIYFQIQIETPISIRVFTRELKINKDASYFQQQHNEIVHANSLRKLSDILYNEKNFKKAKNFCTQYRNFNEKNKEIEIKQVNETLELVDQLTSSNLCEKQLEIIINNKKINSFELVCGKKKIGDHDILGLCSLTEKQIENFTWSKNGMQNKSFNEFKNKITQCYQIFNITPLIEINKNSINARRLLTSVELIKQAFIIIQIIECFQVDKKSVGQNDSIINDMKNYLNNSYKNQYQIQTNSTNDSQEKIIEDIQKLFSNFEIIFNEFNLYSQKQCYQSEQGDWNNEKPCLLEELLKELIEFINEADNENLQNDLEEISLALIEKAGYYSSKAEFIEKKMIQQQKQAVSHQTG